MSFFHDLITFFECKQIIFLNFFPYNGILVFGAAILAYKEKTRILKMHPIQFLIFKIKALFVPNSKPLPCFAQFRHVSAVLYQILRVFLVIKFGETSNKHLAIKLHSQCGTCKRAVLITNFFLQKCGAYSSFLRRGSCPLILHAYVFPCTLETSACRIILLCCCCCR